MPKFGIHLELLTKLSVISVTVISSEPLKHRLITDLLITDYFIGKLQDDFS